MSKIADWKILAVVFTSLLYVGVSSADDDDHTTGTNTTNTTENFTITRIYNGDKAQIHYPFMVAVIYRQTVLCGGALVDNKNFVTAAHCVIGMGKYSGVRIILGAFNLLDKNVVERKYTNCWIPTSYTPGDTKSEGDIGICHLDKPVEFSSTVRTICVPKSYAKKVDVTLIGFGKFNGTHETTYLQYADGTTTLNSNCPEPVIKESQICAVLHNKKGRQAEMGEGDSGALEPLEVLYNQSVVSIKECCKCKRFLDVTVIRHRHVTSKDGIFFGPLFSKTTDGKYNLIGVVSYSSYMMGTNIPLPTGMQRGVYTRPSSYVTFLSAHGNIDTNCQT